MIDLEGLARFLSWDSEFFGRQIAKVLPDSLTEEQIQSLDAWCQNQQIDCLYFLSAETGGPSISLVENNGFHLVDLRVTLSAKLDPLIIPAIQKESICLATDADVSDLRTIAAHNHVDSRFYADPHFERSKCDELYAIWIENAIKYPKQKVFTYKPEGQALGYVSYHKDESNNAVIGLVGIAKECQGQGIATLLTNACLADMQLSACTQVEVVTQGRNTKAIQLYEKCGFRLKSNHTWFHKWYD